MKNGQGDIGGGHAAEQIAQRFVKARLFAESLPNYPGIIPPDLASGYQIQQAAIALWPDEIVGWKIGRVAPEFEDRFGRTRLVGPIFRQDLRKANGTAPTPYPVFEGGFSAVEAEFVYEIAQDAPAGKLCWTEEEALAIAGKLFIGVETAGSPLATINDLGPTVIVSDFGNNAGLILGREIANWRGRAPEQLTCETFIEGRSVGKGGASSIPGGPVESLRFLLEHTARMGQPLKAGMLISSGAATGVHGVKSGQAARINFGQDGEIACLAVTAKRSHDAKG